MSEGICINISIPTDDEGYILLKCEHCGTCFKATPSDIEDVGVLHLFCPSCGLISDNYLSEDVIELAMRKMTNTVNNIIYDNFKELERCNNRNSIIKFKSGNRPKFETEEPIRSGIEALEIVSFPCCKRTAKIKTLLKMTGAYCPFCGVKNYEIE